MNMKILHRGGVSCERTPRQMTALAISGMMITDVFLLTRFAVLMTGPVGKVNTCFACCTISANMSLGRFCGAAPILSVGCVIEGVTTLHVVVCYLLCDFGTVTYVTVGCTILGGVATFCTIVGETVIYTLRGVRLSSISTWGDVVFDLCDGRAPSKIAANRSSASI
jgi:hypothetical protein